MISTRWSGEHCCWLWEIEAAYQFGRYDGDPHSAGFYTIGAGRKLSLPWSPVVWVYYDWASGDKDPTDDFNSTFNQLFPLGHKYFGFMDIVGRQNIEDWNVLLTLKPCEKLSFLLWWHVFHLQQPLDALYGAGGLPIRLPPPGGAGRDVGQELDLTLKYSFTPRADILFGYSHLFAGDFIVNTTPPGGGVGQDFYYTQFSLRF